MIRLGTLFSGVGTPEYALEKLCVEHKLVFACEYDKYARETFIANHEIDINHFHKDINEMDGTQYIGKVDVLVGGSPCFVAGTKVITKNGYKNIENIEVGDEVLTHKNRFKKVLRVGGKDSAEVYKIKFVGLGQDFTYVTAEHPYYVYRGKKRTPEWIEVKDLELDTDSATSYDKQGNLVSHKLFYKEKLEETFKVYNIEVEEDNSYTANNAIVHNCQSFSIAGYRNGLSDHRGQLIYEYARIVDEVRPTYFVYENVKGMISIEKGESLSDFMELLSSIGYDLFGDVVNTKNYGIPQNRERIYIVGKRRESDIITPIFDVNKIKNKGLREIVKNNKNISWNNDFSYAETFPLTKRLKDILESNVDESYYLSHKLVDTLSNQKVEFKPHNKEDEASTCLTAAYYKMGTTCPYIKEENNVGRINSSQDGVVFHENSISQCLSAGHGNTPKILEEAKLVVDSSVKPSVARNFIRDSKLILESNKEIFQSESESNWQDNKIGIIVSPTLRANNNNCYCLEEPSVVAMRGRNPENPTSIESGLKTVQMIEPNMNGISNCLTSVQKDNLVLEPNIIQLNNPTYSQQRIYSIEGIAPTISAGSNGGGKEPVCDYRIRKLTPRECFRLQGFSDNFIINKVSNTQAYKQAGNGMSVNILEMVFCSIYRNIKDERFKFTNIEKNTNMDNFF